MKWFVYAALWAVAATMLSAQTLTTLHDFNMTDGYYPAGMLQATDGNLYGITNAGGANKSGTVFKITPAGAFSTVYNFCSVSGCTDGSVPTGLMQASDGDLYGTTSVGGTNNLGTVFKMTLSGTLTVLYSFCSKNGCPDGSSPQEGLVEGADGNFYGTTLYGGVADGIGYGTVFKITPGGTLTNLHSFCSVSDCADGGYPFSNLVQATNGAFYGTTWRGGAYGRYLGTIFKSTPTGTFTTVYNFMCTHSSACANGADPHAGLIQASNGELYGTTTNGGAGQGPGTFTAGTVFEITLGGTLATLNSFCYQSVCPQGSEVQAALIQASDGNLYGTSTANGTLNGGTVFSLSLGGTLTTVYSFCYGKGCMDSGYYPDSGLVQDTNGDFYGTTSLGGSNYDGTIFRLSTGLGPFVKAQPSFGKVGTAVTILGTNLTGASSVTFNGTAASFAVNSTGSAISTTVPPGATSGKVQVVKPGGILSGNVPFLVRPI